MNKTLPRPQKTLKTFILENDAKIVDKTGAKIAITSAFIAINIMANTSDANAKGHSNHTNHQNKVNVEYDFAGTGYHVGNNFYEETKVVAEIPGKDIQSSHANHYNHKDGGGQGGCSDGFQNQNVGGSNPEVGFKSVMPTSDLVKLKESNED